MRDRSKVCCTRHGIPQAKPMFVTEHDPVHGQLGTHELNLVNGAGLVKSLYFSSVYSPGMTVMPWVLYHIDEIQTQFMWFDGPNEPDTKADELRLLPSGCSMKLLSMHKKWEIAVDNDLTRDELVLASVQNDGLAVQAVNYGDARDVRIQIRDCRTCGRRWATEKSRSSSTRLTRRTATVSLIGPYTGGPQIVAQGTLAVQDGCVTLTHQQLTKNGILMWMLTPPQVGAVLSQPAAKPEVTVDAAGQPAGFDLPQVVASARAEPQASIVPDGERFRVQVTKCEHRPGITFSAPAGGWSMAGIKAIEATVRNTGSVPLPVHLALDGPGAERTSRKNCTIISETIAPGGEKTLVVPIMPVPPRPVEWLSVGKGKPFPYPESPEKNGYHLALANAISVYVYHPGREYRYEVSGLRANSE